VIVTEARFNEVVDLLRRLVASSQLDSGHLVTEANNDDNSRSQLFLVRDAAKSLLEKIDLESKAKTTEEGGTSDYQTPIFKELQALESLLFSMKNSEETGAITLINLDVVLQRLALIKERFRTYTATSWTLTIGDRKPREFKKGERVCFISGKFAGHTGEVLVKKSETRNPIIGLDGYGDDPVALPEELVYEREVFAPQSGLSSDSLQEFIWNCLAAYRMTVGRGHDFARVANLFRACEKFVERG